MLTPRKNQYPDGSDSLFSKMKVKRPPFFFLLCCLAGLFFNTAGLAQKTSKPTPPPPSSPADCKLGCTSNDVQIVRAYLSDADGNKLGSSFICPQTGTADVFLTLELTTNTPRVGVVIFGEIWKWDPVEEDTVGSAPLKTMSECFGDTLNKPTNKVTFQSTFKWTCGTPIAFTKVFIGWGTGNTNFCTSDKFQCPGTSSKCYQLPPDQAIGIETPSTEETSQTKCSTNPGGTTAVFDLKESDNDVKGTQTGVTVKWYLDAAGTNELTDAGDGNADGKILLTNTSNPQTVYARVCSNTSPFPCSGSQAVVLTVIPKPVTLVLTGSSICASAPGTGTVSSSTSESGVSYQLKNGSNQDVQAAQEGTGSGLQWTGLTAGTGYHVVATGAGTTACPGTSNSVNVSSVDNPVTLVLTGSSICASAPGTGTVSSSTSESGVSYQLKNGSNQDVQAAQEGTGSGLQWTGLTAGTGYHVVATGAGTTACPGTSNSVNVSSVDNPPQPSVTYNYAACDETTFSVTVTGVIEGATYIITDKNGANIPGVLPGNSVTAPNTNNITFSNIPPDSGYQVTVKVGTCYSIARSCGVPTPPEGETHRMLSRNTQLTAEESQLKLTAYPNPFNDKINFVINSSLSGKGSLEVYNALGQKIKTVYQGTINKGTQSFELRMPVRQQANLVYVLRVGDKQLTGKILQLNR